MDFRRKALKESFFHKLFYICTSPIFFIGFLIDETLVYSQFGNNNSIDWMIDLLLIFPFIIWIVLTGKLWDLVNGNNLPVTKNQISDNSIKKNFLSRNYYVSRRWITITLGIPFLLLSGASFFANYSIFLVIFLLFLGLDVLGFFLAIIFYKSISNNKNKQISFMTRVYNQLFSETDISGRVSGITLTLLAIEVLFNTLFIFVTTFELGILFLLIYLSSVMVFIITIFSERISYFKRFKKPPKTSEDTFLESLERSRKGPYI